jgi:hypothetical protein
MVRPTNVILGKFSIMATKQSVRGGWSSVVTGVRRSRVPLVWTVLKQMESSSWTVSWSLAWSLVLQIRSDWIVSETMQVHTNYVVCTFRKLVKCVRRSNSFTSTWKWNEPSCNPVWKPRSLSVSRGSKFLGNPAQISQSPWVVGSRILTSLFFSLHFGDGALAAIIRKSIWHHR